MKQQKEGIKCANQHQDKEWKETIVTNTSRYIYISTNS